MAIYYYMIEAVPSRNNPEGKQCGGAYINCWVNAAAQTDALIKAIEYIDDEDWIFMKTEDAFIAQRDSYLNEPDSLKCYDEACKNGISAIFYTWQMDES